MGMITYKYILVVNIKTFNKKSIPSTKQITKRRKNSSFEAHHQAYYRLIVSNAYLTIQLYSLIIAAFN